MACRLLDLGRQYGWLTPEGTELALSLSRREQPAMVGVASETAMHCLSEFRDEGILRTDGRQVIPLGPERLEALG
jgi:CRP-like cAMP-binding protein